MLKLKNKNKYARISVPRVVKFTGKLTNVGTMEGRDATFRCSLSPADAKVTWYQKDLPIVSGSRFLVSQDGMSHAMTIIAVSLEDAGKISAEAEGQVTKANLQVQGESNVLLLSILNIHSAGAIGLLGACVILLLCDIHVESTGHTVDQESCFYKTDLFTNMI